MIQNIYGSTADEVWQRLADKFRSGEKLTIQPSRSGETKELLHVGMSISDPKQRWVVSRNPPLNLAFAIAEVVWIINGRNDANFLNYWNSQLQKFAGYDNTYHGAYGYRLRKQLNIDQIQRAFEVLKSNPHSRQVVLQIWDSKADLPNADGTPVSPDIPCNVLSLLKARDGKLEWMQIMRSNDLFLGLPHNFVQFTTLQEVIAGWLDLEVGHFNQLSDSLHVYTKDIPEVIRSKEITISENSDNLAVSKKLSEKLFLELAEKIDLLAKPNLTREEMDKGLRWNNTPDSYRNLLFVLFAEAARRRKWVEFSSKIMEECSNPLLKQLWIRWVNKPKKSKSN